MTDSQEEDRSVGWIEKLIIDDNGCKLSGKKSIQGSHTGLLLHDTRIPFDFRDLSATTDFIGMTSESLHKLVNEEDGYCDLRGNILISINGENVNIENVIKNRSVTVSKTKLTEGFDELLSDEYVEEASQE